MSKREFQDALGERQMQQANAENFVGALDGLGSAIDSGMSLNRENRAAHKFSLLCATASSVATLFWLFSSGHHYWFWKVLATAIIGALTYALVIQAIALAFFVGVIWIVILILIKLGAFH